MIQGELFKKEPRTSWTEKEIRKWLRDDKYALKGACILYDMLTAEEQHREWIIQKDGRGFNALDGKVLIPIIKKYYITNNITPAEVRLIKSKIWKYSKQLTRAANELLKRKHQNNDRKV